MKKFHVKMLGLAAVVILSAGVASAQVNIGSTAVPTSTLQITGSEGHTFTALSGNATLDASQSYVSIGSGVVCTLPNPAGIQGRVYTLRAAVGAATPAQVKSAAGQILVRNISIASGSSLTLNASESITLISDGTNWYSTSTDISGYNTLATPTLPVRQSPVYVDASGNMVGGAGGTNGVARGTLYNYAFGLAGGTASPITVFENMFGVWEITVIESNSTTSGTNFASTTAKFLLSGENNGVSASLRYVYGNSDAAGYDPTQPITTSYLALAPGFSSGSTIKVTFPNGGNTITLTAGQVSSSAGFQVTSSLTGNVYVEVKKLL